MQSSSRFKPQHTLTPIHIKLAATRAALECIIAHRIFEWGRQQLATVRALQFRGSGDGPWEAEFVVDEVVEEGQ